MTAAAQPNSELVISSSKSCVNAMVPIRKVARLVVLDAAKSVLMLRYQEYRANRADHFWATPGGRIESGEKPRDAAIRELSEETGLQVPVGPELWRNTCRFELPEGLVDQEEHYFLVQLSEISPAVRNSSAEAIAELRWWTLEELETTSEVIYPDRLASHLEPLIADRA